MTAKICETEMLDKRKQIGCKLQVQSESCKRGCHEKVVLCNRCDIASCRFRFPCELKGRRKKTSRAKAQKS